MHKHTVSFEDFNGNPRTKELYFNLSEAELVKMQNNSERGLDVEMQEAIQSKDSRKLLNFLEMIVHQSYGIKSEDGLEFNKSIAIMSQFENSAYYSPFYMGLFENEGAVAVDFINQVMPARLINAATSTISGGNDSGLKPNAREIFEQHRANLQDHLPKSNSNNQNESNQSAPQQYVPQNQPVYPQVPESQPVQVSPQAPPTPQPVQFQEAPQHNIQRPPHESGPGYTQ